MCVYDNDNFTLSDQHNLGQFEIVWDPLRFSEKKQQHKFKQDIK